MPWKSREPNARRTWTAHAMAIRNCARKWNRCSLRMTRPAPFSTRPLPAAPKVTRPLPDSLGVGAGLGPYRIVQLIAEGGMGAVYQAVRVDDLYRKVVAIKVVRRGVFGDYALKRFDTERQILAHLDHPNIAKLLDGGATPDGRPYFVMDFIAGTPIDEYCNAHRLTIGERLNFFLTSAPPCITRIRIWSSIAISSRRTSWSPTKAPSSCWISASPSCFDPDALETAVADATPTLTTMQAMTPEYASPEQLHGEPVTTASDVYSLGVLLYRLLDRPPAVRPGIALHRRALGSHPQSSAAPAQHRHTRHARTASRRNPSAARATPAPTAWSGSWRATSTTSC